MIAGAFIISSPVLVSTNGVASASQGPSGGHNLGFWLQESDPMKYPVQTFFNAMFLTPPYPSSLDLMIFAPIMDESAGTSPTSPSSYTQASISYWSQVAQLADAYPSIRLIFDVAYDATSSTYGLSVFQMYVNALSKYPSVYGIGIEGEYFTGTKTDVQNAFNLVTAAGKQFITYYLNQKDLWPLPQGGYEVKLTPFPMQGGQVSDLGLSDPQFIGLSMGYYANFPFPVPNLPPPNGITCPIGPDDIAPADSNPVTNPNQGFNQCVVSTILSAAVNFQPVSERQFVELCPGFSGSAQHGQPDQPFTGVSGLTTYQLWDNPTLRNWIWTDPNYAPYFTLSTSASPPPSSTTTTSTTSSTPTSTTTSHTTTSTSTTTSHTTTSTTSTIDSSTTSSTSTATTTTTTRTTSGSVPYPYIYVQSSLGFILGTNVSVTSLSVDKTAQEVTFTASHVSWEFLMPQDYALTRILDNGVDVTADAHISANSTGTLYLMTGSSNWEIDYSQPGSMSTTTSTSTSASTSGTTTTTSGTTSTSTSSTSTSTTLTWSTTTVTSSTPTSQTSSQTTYVTTTAPSTSQDYTLSVLGGCPSTGSGVYSPGSTAIVQVEGVCDRNGYSGMRVISWSLDGGTRTPVLTNGTSSLSVLMNGPHTVAFYTVEQYSLSLDYGAQNTVLSLTQPQIPGDNYWYDSGTVVTFVGGLEFQGYAVAGWELDGGSPNLISGAPDLTTSFLMNGPHTLAVLLIPATNSCATGSCSSTPTAIVTVQTNASAPSGVWVDDVYYPKSVTFDWPAGSAHNLTAAVGMRQSSVRTQFAGWSGLSGSESRTIIIAVNASGRLTADYSKQYLVTLAFTDARNQALTPQTVTLRGPSGTQTLAANLSVWVEPEASYTITSAIWMGWNVVLSNDSSFRVTRPSTLTVQSSVYPQTIKATDVYNLPLQGALVNVTTLDGATLSVITDAQGMAVFRVPVGLFSATVSYMGVSNQVVSQSEGSHSYTVSFLLSYPLVATIGAVSATALTFALLRIRKHEDKGIYTFSDQD